MATSSAARPGTTPSRSPRDIAVFVIILAFLFLYPFIDQALGLRLMGALLPIGIYALLAMGLNIVVGYAGLLDLGYAAFFAIGAYTIGFLTSPGSVMVRNGWIPPFFQSFWPAMVVAFIVAAIFGVLLGAPTLRLRGDYLAIVTLGFGEIVRVLIQQTPQVLMSKEAIEESPAWKVPFSVGGSLGFGNVPKYTSHFWVYGAVVLTLIFAYRLKQSSTGRALLSIREDEIAAEAMGVRTTYYKVWGFVFAAFFAGIAGGLYAHTLGIALSPNDAGFQKSFDIIIMVVLGGLGSISGAAIAAAIVTYLPELLRTPATLEKFAIAGVPLLVVGLALYAMAGPARSDAEKKSGRDRRALPRFLIGLSVIIIGLSVLAFAARRFSINLGEYRLIIYALALIVMMITRPQGLLGVRELWDGALYRPIRDFFAPRVGLKGGA